MVCAPPSPTSNVASGSNVDLHDVVVVGTGLAGLSAAVRLAEAGARVLVLAKGVGSTHLAAGTIDVLGYAPERVERPREALAGFVEAHPGHPYGLVGADGVAMTSTRANAASKSRWMRVRTFCADP